jgi:serine/threonine-protein kinase HipA
MNPSQEKSTTYGCKISGSPFVKIVMNGKRDHFVLEDFKACAKSASMKRGRAEAILDAVRETVSHWPDYADEAGIDPVRRDQIKRTLRLESFCA